ncbi:MAG: hypothetical protein IJ083_08615 [Clostridia bacterium]|nr:hypothetical protein [Clostridia bacterium]
MDPKRREKTREGLIAWLNQFEGDHYTFDMYGVRFTVDLPRATAEKVMDIAFLLIDRIVEAQGELTGAEFQKLEAEKGLMADGSDVLRVVMAAYADDHLFGRFRDIDAMIGRLQPKGAPLDSGFFQLVIRPELDLLIYAAIRHVDTVEKEYESLVYTVFLGFLSKGWGEGAGWCKGDDGNWHWQSQNDD